LTVSRVVDSLPLLLGFDPVEGGHGGWLPAIGGMGPLVVVEGDPLADARLGLACDPISQSCRYYRNLGQTSGERIRLLICPHQVVQFDC